MSRRKQNRVYSIEYIVKKKTKYKIQRKVQDENRIEYIVQDKIRVRIAGWRIVIVRAGNAR